MMHLMLGNRSRRRVDGIVVATEQETAFLIQERRFSE